MSVSASSVSDRPCLLLRTPCPDTTVSHPLSALITCTVEEENEGRREEEEEEEEEEG